MKIAIIGYGFVGKAVSYGFNSVDQLIIDPKYYSNTIEDNVTYNPEYVFVCVPTPMDKNGKINPSILYSVLDDLNKKWNRSNIIIKSTILPAVFDEIENRYNKIFTDKIIYNPEFLTERSALMDFSNPNFHVLGGNKQLTNQVQTLYEEYSNCSPAPFFHMSKKEASIVKYTINTFLATKVTFANEIYNLCLNLGVNYNKVINAVGYDSRIGNSHLNVPGFDEKLGFGGSCFPKDLSAIVKEYNMPLLEIVKQINNRTRHNYELNEREKEQNINYEIL